ncbi:unnamed protein product [Angiostrongylus costaricensis]|uniref:DUF3453 domain-containing protein n=1 Tax=Angiostrongylus costaricensis TaxID=334426 RepID=A0A0R3PEM5_ANGCS|nr:unnamed protein product [Angiostrongylus costaricensis]
MMDCFSLLSAVNSARTLLQALSMNTSSFNTPSNEPTLDGEQQILLQLLEGNSTPDAKAASAVYFRRVFSSGLPRNTADPEKYTRLECMWTIVNLLTGANRDRIGLMIGSGVFFVLPNLLSTPDPRLTERTLNAMRLLLPLYPEHANCVKDTDMLDLIKPSLLENDAHLQELKDEIQTFIDARVVPVLSRCTIAFVD